jgi:prevent-host-death family protein
MALLETLVLIMIKINIHKAKIQLSELVEQAASGTGVIIARGGKPVARLTRLKAPQRKIRELPRP